ncbi:MAG: hypothetical protein HYX62_00375 [Gammaproteobacteria bacterium]|nr:hypothetical protein [Gammaproteobacteria bacterium]
MRDARIGRRVYDAPLDGLDGEFNGLRFVDLVKIGSSAKSVGKLSQILRA